MKRFMTLPMAALMFMMAFVFNAFGQDVSIPAEPSTVNDVLQSIGNLIGIASGGAAATTLAIVLAVSQIISKFVLSPLWDSLKLDPKYKFLVFAMMSLVGAVVPLMMQGASFVAAVMSGGVLLLAMQYGHRIYELFIEKPK